MTKLRRLRVKIEKLRHHMNVLLQERESPLAPEVIASSQRLDVVLVQYHQAIAKKRMDIYRKTIHCI